VLGATTRGGRIQAVAICLIAACLLLGQSSRATQPPASAVACPPPPPPVASTLPNSSVVQVSPTQIVIACVASQPVTEAMFEHWNVIAAAGSRQGPASPPDPEAHKLLEEVMGFLLSADWVIGEARDLGIHTTPTKVQQEFHHLRVQQFRTRREFQAFLKKTKQTVSDLLFRTELDLLSEQIQRHAVIGHHGAHSQARALKSFVTKFRRKWTSQTYCTPQYAVQDCGHVQADL
jgi:hypothetical protein